MTQHQLHQIARHVHWLTPSSATDRPVLGVVSGSRGTLIVDTGNSPAHVRVLLDAIAPLDIRPPAFAMMTHWHWDHSFGGATLDLPTLAHQETQRIVRIMAGLDWSDAALDQRVAEGTEIAFCSDMIKAELPERSDLRIRPPEIGFVDQIDLDLGDVTCQIIHVGGDHAHDSSVVYIPDDRVMFLGDCIYDDIYHGPRRCTTATLLPLYERLLSYDAAFYLGGHHDAPITREELVAEAALLTTIGRVVEHVGDDREAILAALPAALHTPLEDDHAAIADAFLAGMRMPTVASVL